MSDVNYLKRYKFYKARCTDLSLKLKRMETIMESCRMLLESGSDRQELKCGLSLTSPLMTSTPRKLASTSRKLSFSNHEESDDMSHFEPRGNKWECISDKERLNYGPLLNYTLSTSHQSKESLDLIDETCYEEEEKNMKTEEETHKTTIKRQRKDNTTSEKLNASSLKPKKPTKEKQRASTPPEKHICKLPRCPQHQPFYVSSIRKMNELSPKTRLLATNRRQKSPKGYWDLDMPK